MRRSMMQSFQQYLIPLEVGQMEGTTKMNRFSLIAGRFFTAMQSNTEKYVEKRQRLKKWIADIRQSGVKVKTSPS